MQFFIATVVLCVATAAAAPSSSSRTTDCFDGIITACQLSEGHFIEHACTANYTGIEHVANPLREYINSQLAVSYDYVVLATHFNSYHMDRPGFKKLFDELAEEAWANGHTLIKYLSKRGGWAYFGQPSSAKRGGHNDVTTNEIHAVGLALDWEKKLAREVIDLHRTSNGAQRDRTLDPVVAQFLQDAFFEKHSNTIWTLAGYVHDLVKLLDHPAPELALNLFDEYLQSAEMEY